MRYNAGFGGVEANRLSTADPQYPQAGAMIDYWLSQNSGPVRLDILSSNGELIRRLSSEAPPSDSSDSVTASTGAQRLSRIAGVNRIVWDMQYPGAWDSNARRSGRGGPLVAPGTYTVRLTANGITQTQKLVLRPDPRVVSDGVTTGIMRDQALHNLRARDLVSAVNRATARLNELKKKANASPQGSMLRQQVDAIDRTLITPQIRYSRPGLQAQIQYLYGAAAGADQKVGNDAIARYAVLKKELDAVMRQIVTAENLAR
jgi:cellobiose-specific phosphotransferase system component IIB